MKWKPIQKKCNLILVRKKKTEFFFVFFFLFSILKGSAVVGAALFPLFTVSLGRSRLRDLPSILRANGSARERETKQHAHLKPTTPPITPLTDDVQKWDDPKERRSVKRMIIYFIFFFRRFPASTDAQMGAGIGSCAHQRVIHAKRPRLSFRAGLAAWHWRWVGSSCEIQVKYPPTNPPIHPLVYIHLVARRIRSGATKKNVSNYFSLNLFELWVYR